MIPTNYLVLRFFFCYCCILQRIGFLYPILPTLMSDHPRRRKPGSEGTAPVSQVVVEIDERSRIRIPSYISTGISWLDDQEFPVDALAVLNEPGQIILLPWDRESPDLLARRKELIEEASESSHAAEVLWAFEDRYKRLPIPKDLRPTLGIEALLHLGLPLSTRTHVYLLRLLESLEIMSVQFRNNRRHRHTDELAGLP